MAKRIFISYRRGDTGPAAGRVYDRLSALLSKPNVFFDVATIRGGENFKKKIVDTIGQCDGALIFIGDKWLDELSPPSKSRIWNTKDYVRAEVREALARPMMVLPILVAGARMPDQEQLQDIRAITMRNALPLRHDSFDDDTEKIVATILGRRDRERDWERKRSGPTSKIIHVAGGAAVACVALLTAALAHFWLFDRALSASIGTLMTILLGISTIILGGWGVFFMLRVRESQN
ncbi:toll/interleukin-1 receptor domain-containing protein [Bradyrhizobium sp. URHD0069]|uniref:toll/interleukin-1 receptor domain-containing protein n=1 Tax=Bradyrhizobium sp. URHD0069 TaxID=1380355 RepID=UPI00068EF853|nr:toll/interleukin-1 receptor domain-containing protein [Bradyrhizobium sp. URHD0069]